MAKKRVGQEKESILCLEKSLIISKQKCARRKERMFQLEQGRAHLIFVSFSPIRVSGIPELY